MAWHDKGQRRGRGAAAHQSAGPAPGLEHLTVAATTPAVAASPSLADVTSLASALLQLPDSVVIVDEDGSVAWANSAAQRLFGRSLADGVGISGLTLVHPDDQELVLRSLSTIQGKEIGDPIEIRVESVTGWRLVEIVGTPLRLSDKTSCSSACAT